MTIEEKRREMFEAWFERLNHRKPEIQYWRGGHCYSDAGADVAWLGFNAALDAVVIELPDAIAYTGCGLAIAECRAAIESTGLGLRVLP